MISLAFGIGFLGSLHCLGMCGPLSMGAASIGHKTGINLFLKVFSYQLGRILVYVLLGLVLGLLSQTFVLTGIQKSVSILSGIFLIGLFLFSLDIERFLNRFSLYKKYFMSYSSWLAKALSGWKKTPAFVLGGLNGLLPCGLVYLALIGSMTAGSIANGMAFMLFFGLGTFPAMMAISLLGPRLYKVSFLNFRKVFPVLQLCVGIYLIYRGLVIDMPADLDFYSLLTRGIMCH